MYILIVYNNVSDGLPHIESSLILVFQNRANPAHEISIYINALLFWYLLIVWHSTSPITVLNQLLAGYKAQR